LKELLSAVLPPHLPLSRQQDNPELPAQGQAQADEEEEEIKKHSGIKRSQNIFQAMWGKLQDHQSLRMSP